MKVSKIAVVPLLMWSAASYAGDYDTALQTYMDAEIRSWSSDPVLVQEILAANTAHEGYDQGMIDAADAAWKAEIGQADMPTVTAVLENPAAEFLRNQINASGGAITEIFITDARGLNVAATSPTSDMWQGDEDKFTAVFPNGPDGHFISEVELDESTQTYQAQISVAIVDPASGNVIGTMTVGVNPDGVM